MVEIINSKVSTVDLAGLVTLLIPEAIGRDVEKATQQIYPLQNVLIRKVKVLKAPKTDLNKLMELHGGAEAVKAFDLANLALGQQVARAAADSGATEAAAADE
jgi:small subunit ribosomal protein S3Ae